MTQRQKYALAQYWPFYGIELSKSFDINKIFSNDSPLLLEIGFGMGESLVRQALENPNWNFIGVDVHRPGIGALLASIHEMQLTNIKVIQADAVDLFTQFIPPDSLNAVQILFPDPWPKKRHHKRRLIQEPFLNLLLPALKSKSMLYTATDWEDYARHIELVLHRYFSVQLKRLDIKTVQRPLLKNMSQTKFQIRGLEKGHKIFEFLLEKI